MLPIGAVCGVGALGAMLVAVVDNPVGKLFGMLLAVVAVAGAWLAIVPERAEQPA